MLSRWPKVVADRVRLISEFYMTREQVDVTAAQRDLEAAEAKLAASGAKTDDLEYRELERELHWAQARLLLSRGESN